MANVFAKFGSSGARIGGKMAAKTLSKKVGKKAAKKLAVKSLKTASKKGAKTGSKKAGKKLGKKFAKNTIKKRMKKTAKQLTKKKLGGGSESRDRSKERKKPKHKKAKASKQGASPKSTRKVKGSSSVGKMLNMFSSSSRSRSRSKPRRSHEAVAPYEEERPAPRRKPSPVSRKVNEPVASSEDLSASSASLSEQEMEDSPKVTLDSSVSPINVRKKPTSNTDDSSEVATPVTTASNADATTTDETPDVSMNTARRASVSARPRMPSLSLKRSRIWPKNSDDTPTRRTSMFMKGSEVTDDTPTKKRSRSSMVLDDMKDSIKRDIYIREAANEVDDTDFNLMLFRLAKHLMLDNHGLPSESTKPEKPRKKKKRKQKTSEWLQALSMVLDAQKEAKETKDQTCCRTTCECACGKKEKGAEVMASQTNGEEAATEKQQNGEHTQEKNDGAKPLLKPAKPRKRSSSESSPSESSTDASSFSSTSTSSYSPGSFGEKTVKFCDLIRNMNKTPTKMTRSLKSCDCSCSKARATVQPTCRKSPNAKPKATIQSVHPQNCHCNCCRPCRPTCVYTSVQMPSPVVHYRTPVPVPYCANPMTTYYTGVTNVQYNQAIEPSVIPGAIVEPNVFYYPEYYF